MTTLQMTTVERHPDGRIVLNIKVQTDAGMFEFPVSVEDAGTQAKNEAAALRSTLALAESVAASIRQRLD